MAEGVDPELAYLASKRWARREQKHYKAWLKGKNEFKFGKDDDGKPNIIKVL